jgi:hypothetical protein
MRNGFAMRVTFGSAFNNADPRIKKITPKIIRTMTQFLN